MNSVVKKFEFLSWIPCVSGTLGFDRVGASLGASILKPKSLIIKDDKQNQRGYVRLASTHDWTDEKRNNSDGNFHTLLIGYYDLDEEVFFGKILFVPDDRKESFESSKKIAIEVFEIKQDSLVSHSGYEAISNEMEKIVKDVTIGAWVTDLKIQSNGLTELSIIGKTDHDEVLTAAQWSYYYTKYAFHKHQHHLHGVDSLVTVYPNNYKAGLRILSGLKFAVTDIKRHSEATPQVRLSKRECKNLQRAAGIAAYAKSLVEALKLNNHLSVERAASELLLLGNTIQSIEKRTEEIKLDYESGADVRALILWITLIFSPAALFWSKFPKIGAPVSFTLLGDMIAFAWAIAVISALASIYMSISSSQRKIKTYAIAFCIGVMGFILVYLLFK